MKIKQIRVDGYKNLIDCKVNLGDFNVLVGPNNSGKSNLLEAMQMLFPICFGDDRLKQSIFSGLTPRFTADSSICHLEKHFGKDLTFGIVFEITHKKKVWIVDYEVKIKCDMENEQNRGIVSENLQAKIPSKTGPATKYISREMRSFEVSGKSHTISRNISALSAIGSLYPDYEGLQSELGAFIQAILYASGISTFAISPTALRNDIDQEKPIRDIKVSSFDLLIVLERLQNKGKYFYMFKDALCDILELEAVFFDVEKKEFPPNNKKEEAAAKSTRLLAVKRKGDRFSLIQEYSDGTLVVAAILAVLFSEEQRGPILCLEELENCLHPAAVERLLRFLQDHSERWPVVITTHSPYLLNGIRPEDVKVAVVDQTGASHIESVKNSAQLRNYLNKNLLSFGELLRTDFEGFRESQPKNEARRQKTR